MLSETIETLSRAEWSLRDARAFHKQAVDKRLSNAADAEVQTPVVRRPFPESNHDGCS